MYHPTRGGVRGGRDQFTWDDVKVDKHRENYLGHSIKAPVGRWQKGKDLHWYTRDKSQIDMEVAKEEIKRIKEEEEQAMLEALGLAPKRATRPQGNRLDKHEFSELVKRGSAAEDLGGGHAEAARVQGLGYLRAPSSWEASSSLPASLNEGVSSEKINATQPKVRAMEHEESSEDESRKKRKREEKKHKREEKQHDKREEKKHNKREKHCSHDSDKRKHKREKERSRHDSD